MKFQNHNPSQYRSRFTLRNIFTFEWRIFLIYRLWIILLGWIVYLFIWIWLYLGDFRFRTWGIFFSGIWFWILLIFLFWDFIRNRWFTYKITKKINKIRISWLTRKSKKIWLSSRNYLKWIKVLVQLIYVRKINAYFLPLRKI